MNTKRFILASFIVFILYQALDFLIHGVILGSQYMAIQNVWRPDMQKMMWIMWITTCAFSFLFVYIFSKGYEGKGIMEGVRFGLVAGLLIQVLNFNGYVIYPIPLQLAIQWFVFGTIQITILGLVAGLIYKPKKGKK
ncbi:MAG: hypothetical protein KKH98_02025 [Spirochaetes bacterium]|nr:hypothetical protein [Spirochaetota bacterium]